MGSLYSGVDTSSFGNSTITKKIKAFIQSVVDSYCLADHLIQFWTPVRTGGKIYLTIIDQPFDLTEHHKGLSSYRKLCLSTTLVLVNVDEMVEEEEHNIGPVARVFRHGVREFCSDVSHYHNKEYVHRDYIKERGVKIYCALPVFESVGQQCIGVLEILSTPKAYMEYIVNNLDGHFERMDLTCDIPWAFSYWKQDFKDSEGIKSAYEAIEDICRCHFLLFAQMWAASSTTRRIYGIFYAEQRQSGWALIRGSFGECRVWEGKGVVGKVFSSRSACFCNNVSELSINVYPGVLNARKLGLARCFAVCLQSTQADDVYYILEFFLPRGDGDPRNFVSKLVATLEEKIQSSMGAHVHQLGDKLFVEVIKVSSDDELDSFEICDTAHIRSTLGSKVTRGERNVIGNYSELQPSSPFLVQESGSGMQLNLGPWSGVRSYSEVESNSPSSGQEMSLGLHLGYRPLGRFRKDPVVQQNSASPFQEMGLGMHLGLGPRLEPEDDTISSSSVRNYSMVQQRSSTPCASQFISGTDSDFADINAALQILSRAKRRRAIGTFDISNG